MAAEEREEREEREAIDLADTHDERVASPASVTYVTYVCSIWLTRTTSAWPRLLPLHTLHVVARHAPRARGLTNSAEHLLIWAL